MAEALLQDNGRITEFFEPSGLSRGSHSEKVNTRAPVGVPEVARDFGDDAPVRGQDGRARVRRDVHPVVDAPPLARQLARTVWARDEPAAVVTERAQRNGVGNRVGKASKEFLVPSRERLVAVRRLFALTATKVDGAGRRSGCQMIVT